LLYKLAILPHNLHFTYCLLNYVVTTFTGDNSSVLCKIGASVFHVIYIRWNGKWVHLT